MVFVTVGQDHSDDVLETVLDVGEVRQDEVDAGLGLLGEEDAAVNDEELAIDLENGHVSTDFPDSAERYDPQGVLREAGRRDKAGKGGLGHSALLSRLKPGWFLTIRIGSRSGKAHPRFRQILADGCDLGLARLHEGQTDNRVGQDSLPLKNLLGSDSTLNVGHHCADHGVQFEM
ncbi:hypothetical protein SRABI128_05815 [Microbacterium sp. Bi128]|nr:hypothetical protein SRABI128_05815 [Microbacterium sp. Bi128]